MTLENVLRLFCIEDLKDLPEAVMKILNGDIARRNDLYLELIELNNHSLSRDWFQEVYEKELAERGQKKQDFTPNSVGVLAAKLTNQQKGWIYEPTAGNGGMIIAAWWERCQNKFPWDFLPADNMIYCWELSTRAIPILLLNLSIRGMMGYVYHGDVLEQTVKAKYILLNRSDDALAFSEIIKDVNQNLKIYEI